MSPLLFAPRAAALSGLICQGRVLHVRLIETPHCPPADLIKQDRSEPDD